MTRLFFAILLICAPAAAQQAKIQTSMGDIVLQLETEKAPKTVANFIGHAQSGYYQGTVIYRVVPGFVVQMGSVTASGEGKRLRKLPKTIPLETAALLKHLPGTVAMARGDRPDSAMTEFFVNLRHNYPLDPDPAAAPDTTGFAVFARVVAGMEVIAAIEKAELNAGIGPFPEAMPKQPIHIRKILIGHFVDVPPPAAEAPPPEPPAPG